MPEAQQSSIVQSSEPDCLERPSFRTAPWFILGNPSIKSNGMALVLSVIWAAVQGSGIPRTCKITNEEIAQRSGIRGGEQEVRRYLSLAQQAGIIIRHGQHKNRTIELLLSEPENGDLRGLVIPQEILESGSSPTEKLLAAIKMAFPKAKKNWICKRLNISDWTYYTKINTEIKPPEKTNTNPLKKPTQPPEKTNPIGIDGCSDRCSVISKDITNKPAACDYCFKAFLSHREGLPKETGQKIPYNKNKQTPSLKENDNMAKIAYDTPAGQEWLQKKNEEQSQRMAASRIKPHNELKKKPKLLKYANKKYPAEYLEDMEWIKANCPLIHMSARGTQSFDSDIRIVKILDYGPSSGKNKGLEVGEINKILSQAVGKDWYGQTWYPALTKEWCFKNFFDLRFDRESRYEMYRRLNSLMSSEFGGKDKKIHLSEAMVSFYGHSFLMQVANVEPKRPRDQYPADLDEYRRQFNQALEIMPATLSQSEKGKAAWNIRWLKKKYQEDFKKRLPDGYNASFYNEWPKFFNELVEFFDRRDAENIWPGWFNPDGEMVESFLAHEEFRAARGGCRQQGYNKGQEVGCGW